MPGSPLGPDDDAVSTPEGDNEYTPGEPVGPVEGLQTPNGSRPIPLDSDAHNGTGDDGTEKVPRDGDQAGHEKNIINKTFDKLSIGQILT